MNSFILIGHSIVLTSFMISLMHYEQYHALTIGALRKTAEQEGLREGLRAYGRAYYLQHKQTLVLPYRFSPTCRLTKEHVEISFKKEQEVVHVGVHITRREK